MIESVHLDVFRKLLGENACLVKEDQVNEFAKDWTRPESVSASCVLLPNKTEDVSAILAYCHEHKLSVVPSGGRTGLAGGAVARHGELILSLSKMNKILNIDRIGLTAEVEAGVTTQALQEAVSNLGLFYGVDLGSRGTCQIGGI